ncbi:MAG: hypothetical protein IRZ00_00405 [Gemmatimonadetes bacterium]|nr:hypothetical protein [Gemmatimonadota bacterium]
MIGLIVAIGALGAAIAGHLGARDFVRRRLRFVDAVQRARAPWIAGAGAVLAAAPVVWLLPFFGAGTAIVFGVGVGSGVAAGARDIRRLPGGG